jgi:hypothetical protein
MPSRTLPTCRQSVQQQHHRSDSACNIVSHPFNIHYRYATYALVARICIKHLQLKERGPNMTSGECHINRPPSLRHPADVLGLTPRAPTSVLHPYFISLCRHHIFSLRREVGLREVMGLLTIVHGSGDQGREYPQRFS